MKKRTCFLLLIFAGILFLGAVSAAGGDAGDPLISLSFLKNTFLRASTVPSTEHWSNRIKRF